MAGEYYIEFFTTQNPPRVEGVRVRLDLVLIRDTNKPLAINLCDHPLYPELKRYIQANP